MSNHGYPELSGLSDSIVRAAFEEHDGSHNQSYEELLAREFKHHPDIAFVRPDNGMLFVGCDRPDSNFLHQTPRVISRALRHEGVELMEIHWQDEHVQYVFSIRFAPPGVRTMDDLQDDD